MRIIVSIITAPNTGISYSRNKVSACGSVVRKAAPTTAPNVEAIPPKTTMVTSSIEWKNVTLPGVMKPA